MAVISGAAASSSTLLPAAAAATQRRLVGDVDCEADSALVEALGWAGTVLAVCVFSAPIETMVKIYQSKELGDFDSLPYVAMLVMALLWCVYALPMVTPCRTQVLVCNLAGIALQIAYLSIFISYANERRRPRITGGALLGLGVVLAVCIPALAVNANHDGAATDILGFATVIAGIVAFASPLAVLSTVLRTRSVRYMPLPLTLMIFINCTLWIAYGALTRDPFVIVSNGAGAALGCIQLVVYVTVVRCYTPLEGASEVSPLKGKP
jgi:solute carrier family 50 protein (sugar transporter)